jgi:phosphotransferase system HPr (HPr) family protein
MSASSDHQVVVEEVAVLAADLHARPAGQVTRAATGVDARVWLSVTGRDEVDARSVLAVMGLGAVTGQTVLVRGEGPQAAEAVAAVVAVLRAAEAVPG